MHNCGKFKILINISAELYFVLNFHEVQIFRWYEVKFILNEIETTVLFLINTGCKAKTGYTQGNF